MMKNLFVSIIIPMNNLSYYFMYEALPALNNQIYKRFEVIALVNEHSLYDITLLKKYRWLKIIATEKITRPAQKRDIGSKLARGEVLAFIDDDAYPDQLWLQNAVQILQNLKIRHHERLAAVCGPGLLPKDSELWEKIFDEVLKSNLGAGQYTYRFSKEEQRFVDDYPSMNFFIYKKIFTQLGGFNNNYWPGEDSKLCNDLVYKEKKYILYRPNIIVFHHRRKNIEGYLRQHASYGFHRGAFFAHGDKNSRRITYLAPTFFIFYLLIFIYATFAFFLHPISLSQYYLVSMPLILYLFIQLYFLIKSLINTKNPLLALAAAAVLFLTHLVYGIMFVKGFIVGLVKKEKLY